MTAGRSADEPRFFGTASAFRRWLETNHERERELWVGFRKVGSGAASITWAEAVDEALCFGWIDGVRKGLDEERYVNRFTPRRAGSTWSARNVARVRALTQEGRMHPAGLRAFEARLDGRTGTYSYEQADDARLDGASERRFRARGKAWEFFRSQPPSYRKATVWWVRSAKLEETRERRLATLIDDSEHGRRVRPLTPRRRGETV
ncbi:MAG TPA: YdeI/OmpD-associated family protein [Actinomycetota bacterium]|nr:YdeI/OmpD-associated family protein [Actinomycetota bacterium]